MTFENVPDIHHPNGEHESASFYFFRRVRKYELCLLYLKSVDERESAGIPGFES